MNDDALDEAQIDEDAAEAGEAGGVAELEMGLPLPPLEELVPLDDRSFEEADEDVRAELREAQRGLEPDGGGTRAPGIVRLSKNFVLAEFHCCRGHCAPEHVPGAALPALRRLVTGVLQPMRDRFGACSVNSAYRNARHNAHVGGEPRSFHQYTLRHRAPATDVSFARGSVDEWAAEARRRLRAMGGIGGIGRYHRANFVHVDLGPERRWTG